MPWLGRTVVGDRKVSAHVENRLTVPALVASLRQESVEADKRGGFLVSPKQKLDRRARHQLSTRCGAIRSEGSSRHYGCLRGHPANETARQVLDRSPSHRIFASVSEGAKRGRKEEDILQVSSYGWHPGVPANIACETGPLPCM